MPYIINNTDGSLTVTVPDRTVDTNSFSLAIVGRRVSNYGQYFAQNTIRQLENFASETSPSPNSRLTGQLWYDKAYNVMRVWNGEVWKTNTSIIVGPEEDLPTTDLTGGGTAFFNTTDDKLYIHNGSGFREAAYPGEVSSAYSSNDSVSNPTFYGARIRTLFLKDENDNPQPVLALSYVKSTASASANRGTTQIGQHYETIMSLYSDTEFTIKTAGAGTETPVDGETINFAPELIETNNGIASARAGRPAGLILKGQNNRAEYAPTAIIEAQIILATQIGSPSLPVDQMWVNDLTVNGELQVDYLVVLNDVNVGGSLAVTGNIDSSSTVNTVSLRVSNDTILNGDTIINGNVIITGDGVQNLGNATNRIETFYADLANVTTIAAQDITVSSNLTVGDTAQIGSLNTTEITTGSAAIPGTITGTWTLTAGSSLESSFADLAEVYATDITYEAGTVVKLGGNAEITQTTSHNDTDVFGVISTDPAYVMNSTADGQPVAMTGRVPVKVIGAVKKGERLISSGVPGTAWALGNQAYDTRAIIGRALEDKTDSAEGIIEAVIGVK